jgi:hemerythrin
VAINWNDSLETGIPEIDNQHKEMFVRINQLLDACHQGRGQETLGDVLNFLEDYARRHFMDEEALMAAKGYPELASHREMHREFMANVAEVKRRFQEEGPGVHIVVITNRVIAGWLNTHIRRVDKKFGEFLRNN